MEAMPLSAQLFVLRSSRARGGYLTAFPPRAARARSGWEETHLRRGQKGINGRASEQEVEALVVFPPDCSLPVYLPLRSPEPRTCTDGTENEVKGGQEKVRGWR